MVDEGGRDESTEKAANSAVAEASWTFLSNHAHVLLVLAAAPEARLRDVAERVRITERAVQKIVAELEAAGALSRQRDGRRNRYEVHGERALRHPVEAHCKIADLIRMVHGGPTS